MASRDNFVKYIIKALIKDIRCYTIDGDFSIGSIDVTDDLIDQIIEEGARYEYTEQETRELLTDVARNISWAPSVETVTNSVNVHDIGIGDHLVLHFDNRQYGSISISLLCSAPGRFFVLESEIPGIIYHDNLRSVNAKWNMGNAVEFKLFRCDTPILDSNQVLRIETLKSVDFYRPSIIHDIYDSKSTFMKAKKETKS